MIFLTNFILIIFSFLLSNKLIKLFLLKFKEEFIDIPNSRSMHKIPTPRGLGIIFVLITVANLKQYVNTLANSVFLLSQSSVNKLLFIQSI